MEAFWRKPRRTMVWFMVAKLTVIVPVTALAALLAVYYAGLERQRLETQAAMQADQIASDVEQEFQSLMLAGQMLAQSPDIAEGRYARFYEMARNNSVLYDVTAILANSKSEHLVNTRWPFGDKRQSSAEMQALDQKVLKTQLPLVTPMVIGNNVHKPVINVVVPAACTDPDGCTLRLSTSPERIYELLRATQPERHHRPWLALIVDPNHRVVARSRQNDKYFGQSATDAYFEAAKGREKGSLMSHALDGTPTFIAFQRVKGSGYLASVSIPRAHLDALLANTLTSVFVPLGALLAVSFIISMWLSLRISNAIGMLKGYASAVDHKASVFQSPVVEINDVAAKLHTTVAHLRTREVELEGSVSKIRLLINETMHRAKNLLQVVQSMAKQTAMQTQSKEQFVSRFSERIAALASTQNQLVESEWQGVSIAEVIREQVATYAFDLPNQLTLDGPTLIVTPEVAQNFGLAVHELANNALKYGALSSPTGHIDVRWHLTPEQGFEMVWTETGGPKPSITGHTGFGSIVVTRLVAQSFSGKARMDFAPTGLVWTLTGSSSYFGRGASDYSVAAM